MVAINSSEENSWDRSLFSAASTAAEPLCWVWGLGHRVVAPLGAGKFDNYDNPIAEIAYRSCIVVGGLFSLATVVVPVTFIGLGVASKIFRALACTFQKEGVTHIRGDCAEIEVRGKVKIMTLNVCGIGAGMHFSHGGVRHWRDRLDEIVQKIIDEDPDVLVFQEIYDNALAEALVTKLRNRYAHFFLQTGSNVMGGVGGVMVTTKCAYSRFTSTSFENNSWQLNRTFDVLEIKARKNDAAPCARIVGTHLIHDDNTARIKQVAQIVDKVARANAAFAVPTVIAGDLNLEYHNPAERGLLDPHFIHGYSGEEPTCTEAMTRQWDVKKRQIPDETIDYISLAKLHAGNARLEGTRLIKTHIGNNPRTALSDHDFLVSNLKLRDY
jgi:endonuclease/exonuclease/phosphatase family metal-dependent hydrolase